eukprot:926992-Prymnesium_polylepis.2
MNAAACTSAALCCHWHSMVRVANEGQVVHHKPKTTKFGLDQILDLGDEPFLRRAQSGAKDHFDVDACAS